jgi:hypothetical protein
VIVIATISLGIHIIIYIRYIQHNTTNTMTELIIEYSIYKIVCKDTAITDLYVGSTKDIKTRDSVHKSDCRSPNSGRYNLRIYKFIREHGGYENWEMVVLETVLCNRV